MAVTHEACQIPGLSYLCQSDNKANARCTCNLISLLHFVQRHRLKYCRAAAPVSCKMAWGERGFSMLKHICKKDERAG